MVDSGFCGVSKGDAAYSIGESSRLKIKFTDFLVPDYYVPFEMCLNCYKTLSICCTADLSYLNSLKIKCLSLKKDIILGRQGFLQCAYALQGDFYTLRT